jgi:hypothetical protein
MYKLDVDKLPFSKSYTICMSKEGQPVEDYFAITDDQAGYLVDEGDRLVKGGDEQLTPANLDITLGKSTKHGNAYQLIYKVNDNYVKVFILTEVELKLFLASLKRAIDG